MLIKTPPITHKTKRKLRARLKLLFNQWVCAYRNARSLNAFIGKRVHFDAEFWEWSRCLINKLSVRSPSPSRSLFLVTIVSGCTENDIILLSGFRKQTHPHEHPAPHPNTHTFHGAIYEHMLWTILSSHIAYSVMYRTARDHWPSDTVYAHKNISFTPASRSRAHITHQTHIHTHSCQHIVLMHLIIVKAIAFGVVEPHSGPKQTQTDTSNYSHTLPPTDGKQCWRCCANIFGIQL